MVRAIAAPLFAAVLLVFCSITGHAAGFMGPGVGSTVTSAAQVLEAQDDAPCILEGHLIERIPQRKNRYLFEDATGRVVVKISNETFGPLTVTPKDKLRLMGEVEWNNKRPNEVDVEGLAILSE